MAPAQSTPSGLVELPLKVVDLTGADARDWLQGQITNDVRTLIPGGAIRGCLCRPTGQLLAHLEIWDLGQALRLLVHERELTALLTRIEEAVIVEEVEATLIPARVMHAFGPESGDLVAQLGSDEAAEGALPPPMVRARSRTGSAGFDVVQDLSRRAGEAPSSSLLFDALTLAAGEPIPGVDTTDRTLSPELGPAFEAATISYRKGCYTGQEILMRLHSRGHTNRTWTGLLSPVRLEAGMRVTANGTEVGHVTRAGEHPTLGFIAGAFLRREADGQALTVDGSAVEARDLPLSTE